jgi:hypothetical protein
MTHYEKFIRDPIYGFIGFTKEELKLLDTPVVQRLRRIKQLGNTHLIYPGANHTRFEHSLGVMHVATRMAKKLDFKENEIVNIRFAALLHDIGHGPLSHNFELALSNNGKNASHEDATRIIIENDRIVGKILGKRKKDVLALFDEHDDTVNSKIISGNIDADRLDYLRRDSYHIGVAYGQFDLERILHTINKKVEGDRSDLTVLEKGKEAVENFRIARYLMYTQVYFHHARLIADKMFERAVKVAIRDGIIDKSRLNISDDDFINYYLSLDDDRLFQKILSNEKSNAYRLIDDLDNRRLMKAGYDVDINNLSEIGLKRKLASAKHDEEIENYIADKCGCNKDFIIAFSVEIDNPLYKSSNEFYKADKTPILIEFENGDIKEFDLVSPFELKKNSVIKFYILGLEKDKEKIVKASKNLGKDV